MAEQNIVAWRYSDLWAEIAKKIPNEPTFPSADLLGKVSLPLFMIASQHDEYTSADNSRKMAALAKDPKQLVIFDAKDHKYGGNTQLFFATSRKALVWVEQQK